jgi:hypothetical protein
MKRLIIGVLLAIFLLGSGAAQATNVASTVLVQRQVSIWGDWKVTWTGITTTANTCTPFTTADKFSGITVQVFGTWGAGTPIITLWGSNDGGTTWFALTALQTSSAMSFAGANGHGTVLSTPVQQIKWVLSGGDGTTSLTVIVKGQR